MICSEFVAWVYQRAGLDPQVTKWWRGIEEGNFLTNDNRRKDYTTPNMLAFSPKFKNIGCLKGVQLEDNLNRKSLTKSCKSISSKKIRHI